MIYMLLSIIIIIIFGIGVAKNIKKWGAMAKARPTTFMGVVTDKRDEELISNGMNSIRRYSIKIRDNNNRETEFLVREDIYNSVSISEHILIESIGNEVIKCSNI